jgi:hypothetical protein
MTPVLRGSGVLYYVETRVLTRVEVTGIDGVMSYETASFTRGGALRSGLAGRTRHSGGGDAGLSTRFVIVERRIVQWARGGQVCRGTALFSDFIADQRNVTERSRTLQS